MTDCDICHLPLEGEDLAFAQDQAQHPGYLGELHPACYSKLIDHDATLPWTDPISGETDFAEMESDLGFGEPGVDYEP